MKRLRWLLPVSFFLLMCLVWPAAASAQPAGPQPGGPMMGGPGGPPPPAPPPFWKDPQIVKTLGLSAEQVKSLDDLEYNFQTKRIELTADVEKAHMQFQRLENTDAKDQDVLAAAQKAADLHGKMFLMEVEHRLKMKSVLSAEQREKLKTLLPPPMHGRGPGGPGESRGPGPGPGRAPEK